MFFNEAENNPTDIEVTTDTEVSAVDLDLEEVDLDYDALKQNGFKPNVNYSSSQQGIDLDYSGALDANGNSSQIDDTYHEEVDLDLEACGGNDNKNEACGDKDNCSEACGGNDNKNEACGGGSKSLDDNCSEACGNKDNKCEEQFIDLDYDSALEMNGNSSQLDTYHEEVDPISFSESSVRVFAREDYNLITESDLTALLNYYGGAISISEAINLVAEANNINEDSIKVLAEANKVAPKNKAVKPKFDGIDIQIKNLLAKKSKMTPEQWKKGGYDEKLKKLRARKALKA